MVLVVEHESSRSARWLRQHRARLALWAAVAEGLLVVFGVIPGWIALAAAVALVLFYVVVGRKLAPESARQLSWIAAVSQLLVAMLPILVGLLTVTAIVGLVVLGTVALALLFVDRR